MEPMELDDDEPAPVLRVGHLHKCKLLPAKFRPSSADSSNYRTPWLEHGTLSDSPAKVAGTGKGRILKASSSPGWNTISGYSHTVSDSGFKSARNFGFQPGEKMVQRKATAVESQTNQRQAVWQDEGNTSINSSERSDVSDMEVNQCSPSPSWERVISAFRAIAVFKGTSEPDPTPEPKKGEITSVVESKDCGDSDTWSSRAALSASSGNRSSAWEPALTVTHSVAVLKNRKHRSKSPEMQQFTVCASQEQSTPVKKLSWEGDGSSANDNIKTNPRISHVPDETLSFSAFHQREKGSKNRRCMKLLFMLVLAVTVFLGIVFQIRVVHHRRHFAELDAELLKNEMASKVFGQHIAIDVVPSFVQQYISWLNENREKCSAVICHHPPLVLSFHGWTGVGKNFVSDIIAKLLPSKTLTKLLVPYHFPHKTHDDLYARQVEDWILSNVTNYHVNFFIFDEMDKSTSGVVQGLRKAISKLASSNPVFAPSIFLLLSNTLGSDINKLTFQAMLNGKERDSLTADDFSRLFNECDVPWFKNLLSDNMISVAVPFLPLEKQHVIQCIRRDLVSKKMSTQPDVVARVLKELTFVRLQTGHEFSQTGCKRVFDKVNLIMFGT